MGNIVAHELQQQGIKALPPRGLHDIKAAQKDGVVPISNAAQQAAFHEPPAHDHGLCIPVKQVANGAKAKETQIRPDAGGNDIRQVLSLFFRANLNNPYSVRQWDVGHRHDLFLE